MNGTERKELCKKCRYEFAHGCAAYRELNPIECPSFRRKVLQFNCKYCGGVMDLDYEFKPAENGDVRQCYSCTICSSHAHVIDNTVTNEYKITGWEEE